MNPTELKLGDIVVRKGFINFWPGEIVEIPSKWGTRHKVRVFWFTKKNDFWCDRGGLKKVSPLQLLAMCAE